MFSCTRCGLQYCTANRWIEHQRLQQRNPHRSCLWCITAPERASEGAQQWVAAALHQPKHRHTFMHFIHRGEIRAAVPWCISQQVWTHLCIKITPALPAWLILACSRLNLKNVSPAAQTLQTPCEAPHAEFGPAFLQFTFMCIYVYIFFNCRSGPCWN